MRRGACLLATVLAVACAPAPAPPAPAAARSPSATPGSVPTDAVFEPYIGAYRTDAGATLVINGHGHLVNVSEGSIRQLYSTAERDHLTVGPGYQVAEPKQADVVFHVAAGRADQLTETPLGGTQLVAHRMQFKETQVKIPAKDAILAGTVTQPLTGGPHPGIVIVHGSGPGPRIDYGVWVGLYASLGLTVLAYDKRGNGSSTGRYPGELASEENLNIYADDAAAAIGFLASWPRLDPKRLGFHGGSQGGWITPLAMQRYPATTFAVIVSGPAVTVGQQAVWADFSSGSSRLPDKTAAEMDAQLRGEHSGYDPLPALRATNQPVLWLNGSIDRQVPTALNTEILSQLAKPRFDVHVLPGVDHGLLENSTGLSQDDAKATNFGAGLFDIIAAWLSQHS